MGCLPWGVIAVTAPCFMGIQSPLATQGYTFIYMYDIMCNMYVCVYTYACKYERWLCSESESAQCLLT